VQGLQLGACRWLGTGSNGYCSISKSSMRGAVDAATALKTVIRDIHYCLFSVVYAMQVLSCLLGSGGEQRLEGSTKISLIVVARVATLLICPKTSINC
jgi:hypothetical protein